MTTQAAKRRLAAIFIADVNGYSRLMDDNEKETVRSLTAYKQIMTNLIQEHRGRVVNAPGDNVLAEFRSAISAVECAVEIQKELKSQNADLAEHRRMEFRIGINLGDVIEDGEQILGDGVNIAARLENLSKAGGICISGTVYEIIENKLRLEYEDLGEQILKNITRPVRVYKILIEHRDITTPTPKTGIVSKERMALSLPDKPSIAVLPFVNMSGDPNQDFFSDGLTEEVITALSKSPHLFVIARTSTFTYKGKAVKVKQVSDELGVRYVLEGSVRRSGEKVRITAQLIDATTGYHVWAERFDRSMNEIFAIQDEITLNILKTVHVKLEVGEISGETGRGTPRLDAYLKGMEAREHFYHWNKEENALARKLYEEVIALDPNYAYGYQGLASTHVSDVWLGCSSSPRNSLVLAIELGGKALALDDSGSGIHANLAYLYAMTRQFDKAIAHAETALALDPNCPEVLLMAANALTWSGSPNEAIPLCEKAIRLNPFAPAQYFVALGLAYRLTGQENEAAKEAIKAVERDPHNLLAWVALAITCIQTGRKKEARAAAKEVLRLNPKFSVQQFAEMLPFRDRSKVDQTIVALHKAGLD